MYSSSNRQCTGEDRRQYLTLTEQTSLAIVWKKVVINPETKAHVWVHEKVCNCTTTDVCVLVDVAFGKRYLYDTTYRIDNHTLDTVGCTARNVDEHRVKKVSEQLAYLMTPEHAHPVEGESTAVCVVVCMSSQACASASSMAGAAVVVSVSNQAMLGSSIAEQGNVSDAVSQVVEFQPLYTPVDSNGEIVVGSSVGTVPSGESAVFGCRLSLNS